MTPNPYAPPSAAVASPDTAQFDYVGFWPRVVASLIDTVLAVPAMLPLMMVLEGTSLSSGAHPLSAAFGAVISYLLPAAVVILFWLSRQATPGKMVVAARVIDARTGGPLTLGQSIIRYLGYFLSTIPLGLGLLWVAFDPKKQGWHDKLAGTVVVRSKG